MNSERAVVNEEKLAEVIQTVLTTKNEHKFVFSENYVSPEEPYIDSLVHCGERLQDPNFPANALFMTAALIRGNDTKRFFNSRLTNIENVLEYAWIFDPIQVLTRGKEVTEQACKDYFRPAGYCINAIDNWSYNSELIIKNGGSIKQCFDNLDGDLKKIEKFVYLRNRAKTVEKIKAGSLLNYGQHLAYLAFQWLSLYNLYEFANIDTIPVDFQLARIAIQTDSIILEGEPNVDAVITRSLTPAFRKICLEKKIDPRKVSQTLWTFGSEGCNNKLHNSCPLEKECVRYITSKKYQAVGRLSSEDEGRYK